jgi:hypothetical protein
MFCIVTACHEAGSCADDASADFSGADVAGDSPDAGALDTGGGPGMGPVDPSGNGGRACSPAGARRVVDGVAE